jgi:hypothetical protein
MKRTFIAVNNRVAVILVISMVVGSPAFAEIYLARRNTHVSGANDARPNVREQQALDRFLRTVSGQSSTTTGQALEVIDPREFWIPVQPQRPAPTLSLSGAVRPAAGVPAPRVVVPPSHPARRHIDQKSGAGR